MEFEVDLATINDEDELQRMWIQAEDFARKKEIRQHLYNLREAKLGDYYQTEEEPIITTKTTTTIMSSTTTNLKSPLTQSHGDSLTDQSYQSFKSKEIRDSESPAPELKFIQQQKLNNIDGVIVPDTSGWNIQTSKEIAPDGSGFKNETLATTEGIRKIDGGQVEFAGKNEHMQKASHHGDDKNFVKTAAESSNTHLQESSVVGDENNGRIEKKSSSVTSSSSKHFESKQCFDDNDFENDFKNLSLADKLRMTRKNNTDSKISVQEHQNRHDLSHHQQVKQQERQQYIKNDEQLQRNEQIQHQQKIERQEQIERQHVQQQHRNVNSVSSNIDERYLTTVQNTDGTTYKKSGTITEDSPVELQSKLRELQAQPGRIISRKIEYPKPNVVMIIETKELPDGTVVTTKNYETKSANTKIESKRQETVSQESREFEKLSQQKQQTMRNETDNNFVVHKDRRTIVDNRNEREIYEAELRNEQERDWKRGTDTVDRSKVHEDVEIFDTHRTVKKDLSQTMRKQNITQQDFIDTERGCAMIDRNQHRPERYTVETNDSTDFIKKNDEHVKSYDNVRSKPDFTTHGFPSVVSGKSTNEHVEQHQTTKRSDVRPLDLKPKLNKQPSEHFHGTHGFPSVVDRSDTVSVTSEQFETRSETVQRSSQDHTIHGFPSTRSPTTESRPAAGKPSYVRKSPAKEVTDDFTGTHGFPSVVDRDNKYSQKTEEFTEVHQNMTQHRPAAGKPSYTKSVHKDDNEDFRGTHGFPSVVEKGAQNVRQKTVEKKVVETEFRSSTESLSRQKKTDAAHDAFARSLRCQSPVDNNRRSSNSSRNRNYSPDRENSIVSDSSIYSSNTMTKGVTPTRKTKEVHHSNETIELPRGGVQKNSTSKTFEEYTGEPIKKTVVNKLNRINKKPFEPEIIKKKIDDRFVGLNEVIEAPIIKKTVTKLCPDGCPLPNQHNGTKPTHVHDIKTSAKQSMKSPMIRRQLLKGVDTKPKVITKTTLTTTRKPVKLGTSEKLFEKARVSPNIISSNQTKYPKNLTQKIGVKNNLVPSSNRTSNVHTKRVISTITPTEKNSSRFSNIVLQPKVAKKFNITSHYLEPTESSRHHIEDVIDSNCKNTVILTDQNTKFKPTKSRSPSPHHLHHYLDATESTKNRIKKTTQNFLDIESKRIQNQESMTFEIIDFKTKKPKYTINSEEKSNKKFPLQQNPDVNMTHSGKIKPQTLHGPIPNKSPDGYVSKKISIEVTKNYKDVDDSKVTYPTYLNKDQTTKVTPKSGSPSPTRLVNSTDRLTEDNLSPKNRPHTNKPSSSKQKTKLPSEPDSSEIQTGIPKNIKLPNHDNDHQTYETIRIEQHKNKKNDSYKGSIQPETPISGSPKTLHEHNRSTDLDSEDKLFKNVNNEYQENTNLNKFSTKETIENQYIPRSMVEEDYPKPIHKKPENECITENEPFYLANPELEKISNEPEHIKNSKPKSPFNRSETFEERCRQVLGIDESTNIHKNIESENFITTERNVIEENRKYDTRSVSPSCNQKLSVENQNKETTEKMDLTNVKTQRKQTSPNSNSPTLKNRSVNPDYANKKITNEYIVKQSTTVKENRNNAPTPINKGRSTSPQKPEISIKFTAHQKDVTQLNKKSNSINLPKSISPNSSPERSPQRPEKSQTKRTENRAHHITSARIEITPPVNKTDNLKKNSKGNISKKKTFTKPHENSLKDNDSPYESDKYSPLSDNEESVQTKIVTTKTISGKKPVKDRKDSAPVYRVSKIDHDQKMSRSTSDNLIKTNQNKIRSQSIKEQLKTSEKKDLKNTIRPQKCLATKTITVTNRDSVINSADIENVIIDIQQAKSSREPSPNKIVPVPVPLDADTGLPRYPDTVQEPADDKRKSKVKSVPIFEEETSNYIGCQITEVDNDGYIRKTEDKTIDQSDDNTLISVREKVTKFINKTEENQKSKSVPFNLDVTQNESETEDNYYLTVNDKVNKFLSTAEELTQDIISYKTKEIFNSKRDSLNKEKKEHKDINKLVSKADKLVDSGPQKSPELVKKIARQISQQSDIEKVNKSNERTTSPNRSISEKRNPIVRKQSESRPINKNDNVKKAMSVFEKEAIKNISLSNITNESNRKDILSRPSVFEGKRNPRLSDIDNERQVNENNLIKVKSENKEVINNSSVTNNVIKKKNIFESYSVTSKNDISSKAQNVTDRLTLTPARESRKCKTQTTTIQKSSSPTSTSHTRSEAFLKDENEQISVKKSSHSSSPTRIITKDMNVSSSTKLHENRKAKSSPSRITKTYTSGKQIDRVSPDRDSLYYGEFGSNYVHVPSSRNSHSPSHAEKSVLTPATYYSKSVKEIKSRSTHSPNYDKTYSASSSPNRRSSARNSPTRNSREADNGDNYFDDYLLISSSKVDESVLNRKKLFESLDTTKLVETQKPSYMDHTKASLEHIRRDSLELARNRKTSSHEEYQEGNPRSSVKFGIELKHNEENKPKRKISSPEIPHIEEIFDLTLLEEMLSTVVGYEHRRRIRAQIRVVKNMVKQKQQEEAQIAYIRDTSPARRSSPSRESTPTIQSTKRKQSLKSGSSAVQNDTFHAKQKVGDRNISTRTKINTTSTTTDMKKFVNEKPKVTNYTKSNMTMLSSNEKPVWASKNILKKATERKVIETTKKSTPNAKPKPHFQQDVDDCITSSYGIGPTDDEGKPLFGIRALKKKSNETSKVTGTVVSETLYSENGQEPVGQRSVTVYSSEPQDIDDYESNHKFRAKNESIHSTRSVKDGVTSVTSTQKYTTNSNILDDHRDNKEDAYSKLSNSETNEFIRKESSSSITHKSTSSSTHPNTEIVFENKPRYVKEYYENNEDSSEKDDEYLNITRNVNKSTKSFLNSAGTKVTDVTDILDRMRNADNVVEQGDTLEDQEARALLNKFLGASVLMSGIESIAPSTVLTKISREVVNSPTNQEKVKTRITKVIKTEGVDTSIPITLDEIRNIEEIWDEDLLKELLEKSTNYEDRRKIRARLRQLMAEREACTDYLSDVKTELLSKSSEKQEDIDSDSSYEYEEIIEEVTDYSEDDEPAQSANTIKIQSTVTDLKSPPLNKSTTELGVKQVNQPTKVVVENKTVSKPIIALSKHEKNKSDINYNNEEGDKLLPLLQDILNKNIHNNINNNINNNIETINSPSSSKMANIKQTNDKISSSRQLTKNNVVQHYIEDSGTESGEDLRLLAAGLRDSMQSASNNSNLIEDVTMALARLEKSLKKGKDIECDQIKRNALLNLVERLQTGLTSPDKIMPSTPVPIAEEQCENNGSRQRFAKRKNRANRHTVGVSREELADARRYMEEMVMMETLSNSTTPETSLNTSTVEQSFPIQKQNSAIIMSKNNEQSKLFRPNQFVPSSLTNYQTQTVQKREKKNTGCDVGKRSSVHLEQSSNPTQQNTKRPLSESYAPNFNEQFQNIANSNSQGHSHPISVPQHFQSFTQEPSTNSENGMSLNRFNKKIAMKRANTIDIPKPMKYLSEMDSDSEAEERGINSTKSIGLRGTVQVSVKNKPKQVVPSFQPKTENDLKFLAFIQKQGPSPSLGWNNPNRSVNNWTNKFSNLKNTFESSAANTAAKPPVPNSIAKNFWKKNEQQASVHTAKGQSVKHPLLDKNYTSDVLTSSLRTKELNEARAQQIVHIPKPIPLNKFSHASQSVFKPIELSNPVNFQQQQFKPIQSDPRLHQSQPHLNQNIYYAETPEVAPTYTWTTLTSAPNSPHTVLSPTKNWFTKNSAPTSPNPTNQLPWSTKSRALNRIRDKAEKYDKRSPPPIKLHRHNSLRSNQEDEKVDYKRPSLPNTSDPFDNPPYRPQAYHLSNPQLTCNAARQFDEIKGKHSFPSNFIRDHQVPQQPQNYQLQSKYINTGFNYQEVNNNRHRREDSLTNPRAEPLVLTNWNPSFNTDISSNYQTPLTIFDYPSPTESLRSPNRTFQNPLENLTGLNQTYQDPTNSDNESIEYKAETRVMAAPIGQQAITIGSKTQRISDDILHEKNSNAAGSLLSVMKNINNKSSDVKNLPKLSSKSPKTCLSPEGRNYIAPNVEAIYPDFSSAPQNRMPIYDEVLNDYKADKPILRRLNAPDQRNFNQSDSNSALLSHQLSNQLSNQNNYLVQYPVQTINTAQPLQNQHQPHESIYFNDNQHLHQHQINPQYFEKSQFTIEENSTPKFDPNPAYEPPKRIEQSNYEIRKQSQPKIKASFDSTQLNSYNISQFQNNKLTMKTSGSQDAVMIESHQLPTVVNQQINQSVQPIIQADYSRDSHSYSNIEKNLNQHRQVNKIYKNLDKEQQAQKIYTTSQSDKISTRKTILAQDASKSILRQDKPSTVKNQNKVTYPDLKPVKSQSDEKKDHVKKSLQTYIAPQELYENTNIKYIDQEKSITKDKNNKIKKISKETKSEMVQKQNFINNEYIEISEKKQMKELQTKTEMNIQNEMQRKTKIISQRSLDNVEYKSSAPEDTPDIVKSSLLKEDIPILKKFGPPQRHHYTPNCYKTPLTKSDSTHELKSSMITRKYSDPAVKAPEITETPATPLPSEEIPKNIVFNNIAQFQTMSRRLSETSTETKFHSINSNRPNPLTKSDSWHQICLQQQQTSAKPPSPKFGMDENGHKLRRAKSGHTLALPKMYEAGLKMEEASEKQKTVAAYFSGQKSPNSLSRNPSSSNLNESNQTSVTVKRSTINRTRTSEKTSTSNRNPSSGLCRSQTMPHIVPLSLLDETNVDDAFEQLLKTH